MRPHQVPSAFQRNAKLRLVYFRSDARSGGPHGQGSSAHQGGPGAPGSPGGPGGSGPRGPRGPRTPSTIRLLWERYSDWRLVTLLVIVAVFVAMILMPAAVALSFRHGRVKSGVEAWVTSSDEQTNIKVYRMSTGSVVNMPLGDYLMDVLAAELPPSSPPQALQAAAVAARTYAVQAMLANRKGQFPAGAGPAHLGIPGTRNSFDGADLTDSGQWDLPMETAAQQAAKWGNQVGAVRAKYQAAILATDGLVLTYQSEPILAFSFALSPGVTRSAEEVFNKSIPYLQAIACPDDKQIAFQPVQAFTAADLATRLLTQSAASSASPAQTTTSSASHQPASSASAASPTQPATKAQSQAKAHAQAKAQTKAAHATLNPADFSVIKRGPSGFVLGVKGPGGRSWSGSTFARDLGLPSEDFTLKAVGGKLVIQCQGIGEDVGLSLHEASVLAKDGKTWQAILAKFYPGTGIEPDVSFNL